MLPGWPLTTGDRSTQLEEDRGRGGEEMVQRGGRAGEDVPREAGTPGSCGRRRPGVTAVSTARRFSLP